MGRIACPTCHHEIDDLLNRCPLCGARTKAGEEFVKEQAEKKKGNDFIFILFAIVFLFVGWAVWFMLGSRMSTAPAPSSSMDRMAEQAQP
jgi:hypothetical protein